MTNTTITHSPAGVAFILISIDTGCRIILDGEEVHISKSEGAARRWVQRQGLVRCFRPGRGK